MFVLYTTGRRVTEDVHRAMSRDDYGSVGTFRETSYYTRRFEQTFHVVAICEAT